MSDDYSQMSLMDMFRIEAEGQVRTLTDGLLALERTPTDAAHTEACMRAAHSIKGAARIVGLDAGVTLAHAMEDCFVAAQRGQIRLSARRIDILLRGVDLLNRIGATPEAEMAALADSPELRDYLGELATVLEEHPEDAEAAPEAAAEAPVASPAEAPEVDRGLRVAAENLNRLLGLAGESMVESRWLKPFAEGLLRLKRMQYETTRELDRLHEVFAEQAHNERGLVYLADARRHLAECQAMLTDQLAALERFDHRSGDLARRMYEEAVSSRMRPFADGTQGFPRLVRDLARSLGKQARLEISGSDTRVDRDILEKIEAPLNHMLRNAMDHAIEMPDARRAAGKPAEGVIRLDAHHRSGMLQVSLGDDGRGIDVEAIRATVVRRGLSDEATTAQMSEAELLEFLFLPGFSMKEEVSEISGRGVGLDVVQDMLKKVRGHIRVFSEPGRGTRFQMQLPLTLSVLNSLMVEIAGELYAFPLAYIQRTLRLPRSAIESVEGREYFQLDGRLVGLVPAYQVLQTQHPEHAGDSLAIVVVGSGEHSYGLLVGRFVGERELVVQPLDRRLGKVPNVTAGALAEDGAPVLIVDVEDMIRSVEKLCASGRLGTVRGTLASDGGRRRKRVLVVDDSLTVRELERKLLASHGYEVEVAVDGMDGWNEVRAGRFDLVVTDIDMPRMSGIELVEMIRRHPTLKSLPVMIVSYKDREEDRQRGLEAGADYYLTKGSFHDQTLVDAVHELIGEAEAGGTA